jgi:hypothetical protein
LSYVTRFMVNTFHLIITSNGRSKGE